MPEHCFSFELTDAYRLARSVNARVAGLHFPAGRGHLRNQAIRAADSMVLNLAEGWGRGRGNASSNHFRIALGSAGEVFAVVDLVGGPEELKQDLRRMGAMLAKLSR